MGVQKFVRYMLCPLALICITPLLIIFFNYIIQHSNGDIRTTFSEIKKFGGYRFMTQKCILDNMPTTDHYLMIFAFYFCQIILYHIVPGNPANGPPTSTGYVPKYKENGVITYSLNIITVAIGYFIFDIPFHELYHHLTPIIIAICIISLIVVFILMFCAIYRPENPSDVEWRDNPIISFYQGWEYYPYWFGINLKQLINSRIGMTQWALICLSFILKDYDNMKELSNSNHVPLVNVLLSPVFISSILQIIYLFKFFWWEIGYFGTIDVMHDRCGFMISWGCLSWVFAVYTMHSGLILSHKLYFSNESNDANYFSMNAFNALSVFLFGLLCIYVNYDADRQKMKVRKADGKCNVFGKPAKIIRAIYKTKDGKEKESILLVSGYWGLSRHFHYVPELLFALMICVPTKMATPLQLFYFIFLVILLVDRTGRDDERCNKKYGKYWRQYCNMVQWKMVPYIF